MTRHSLLFNKALNEHHEQTEGEDISSIKFALNNIAFNNKLKNLCIQVDNEKQRLHTSYYVGLDWVNLESKTYVYVQPKLNVGIQIDYLQMLFSSLKHSDVINHTHNLYEIKFNSPEIEIQQAQDLLTPLLVVQYLSLLREIVRKGLKSSYYKVKTNLQSKIKGKVLVSQTIKQNTFKNKPNYTFCSFDEFGINGLENRLLKKALNFIKRYLPLIKLLKAEKYTVEIFNYVSPAFQAVSDEIDFDEVKQIKANAFFKEYTEAIRLAKLILKRFGYNITNAQEGVMQTPPFWIDMSKMFELYVLGFLKNNYNRNLLYGAKEAKAYYGLPDFLLSKQSEKMVIDTKYKRYKDFSLEHKISDIRQLSGYARDEKVLKHLGLEEKQIADCLIIYPDQSLSNLGLNMNAKEPINGFVQFYQLAIKLPEIPFND